MYKEALHQLLLHSSAYASAFVLSPSLLFLLLLWRLPLPIPTRCLLAFEFPACFVCHVAFCVCLSLLPFAVSSSLLPLDSATCSNPKHYPSWSIHQNVDPQHLIIQGCPSHWSHPPSLGAIPHSRLHLKIQGFIKKRHVSETSDSSRESI